MAERRHVLCVRVGGDRTDSNPCRTTPEKQGMSALTSRPRRTYGYEASKCEIVSLSRRLLGEIPRLGYFLDTIQKFLDYAKIPRL